MRILRMPRTDCFSHFSPLGDLSQVDTRHHTETRRRAKERTARRTHRNARRGKNESGGGGEAGGEADGGEERVKTNPRRISSGLGRRARATGVGSPRRRLIGHQPPRQESEELKTEEPHCRIATVNLNVVQEGPRPIQTIKFAMYTCTVFLYLQVQCIRAAQIHNE